jgi:hypothetical protein
LSSTKIPSACRTVPTVSAEIRDLTQSFLFFFFFLIHSTNNLVALVAATENLKKKRKVFLQQNSFDKK